MKNYDDKIVLNDEDGNEVTFVPENYEEESNANIVSLNDENGEEVQFEFLDMVEYEDQNYAVLMPLDDDENRVVILREEDDDSEVTVSYCSVEDEKILMNVYEIFKERHKEDFDFAE